MMDHLDREKMAVNKILADRSKYSPKMCVSHYEYHLPIIPLT